MNRARILACFNKFNDYLFRIINAFIDLFGIILQGFWFVFGGVLTFLWSGLKAVAKFIKDIFVQSEPEADTKKKEVKFEDPSND
jgi:hypothetical protein